MEKSPGTSTAKRESIREGDDDRYGDSVAEALGIPLTSKMLDFSYGDKSQLTSPEQSIAKQHSPKPKPSSNIPFRILDAPGLRNDFYANLVSWSKFSTHLIVGLGRDVHIWLPQDGARLANISRGIGEVTFVEFAYDSLAAIGRNDGTITFYDVLQDKELESFEHRNSVLCAVWCPNNCDVFVGDDSGEVLHLALTKIDNCYRYLVHQMPSLICHADQICGKVAK
jgi:meiosis-specific APC/C activator protein AMA1